jgi:hypothetical protein
MRVEFLVAGAQKGGTTSLCEYLRQHPGLCLSERKETHFFDTDKYFQQQPVDYSPLHAHFRPQPGQLLGEATPVTMYWVDAPRRVWEYNAQMKLVCVLRNPIDRAYGVDPLPFEEALRAEAERCRSVLPVQHRRFSYVDRGFYSEQIRRLWRFFPPAQTLFLRAEELRQQPQATLDRVFDFLGVPRRPVEPRLLHSRSYLAPMSAAARAHLTAVYEWEIRETGRLLGWDCRDWLTVSAAA